MTETKEEIELKEQKQLERIKKIFSLITDLIAGGNVGGQIGAILQPINYKTSSYMTKGEIASCLALLTFAKQSPVECMPFTDYVEDFCLFKLSESGIGLDKAIELLKASGDKYYGGFPDSPNKPTEGMKKS